MDSTLWRVEYDNDTGPNDEGFWEIWTVTNDKRSFRAESEADAKWLCDRLNSEPSNG